MTSYLEATAFEQEVRNTARALWSTDAGQGAPIVFDGRERDCVFEQEDVTHYIECTTDRTMQKLKDDAKKMMAFRDKMNRANRLVRLWFITREEPTADQRTFGKNSGLNVMSLKEFRKKIIEGSKYIDLRSNYPFGSARDLNNKESESLSDIKYQMTQIVDDATGQVYATEQIAEKLLSGQCIVLLGDYGVGKSMTVYDLFRRISKKYLQHETNQVPVVLNLREHWGHKTVTGSLREHASGLDFQKDQQLVRAFNAGQLVMLLDGFDEIAPSPWSRTPQRLKELRNDAVLLVRDFVNRTRGKSGIIVAGREHFFDDRKELLNALGIPTDGLVLTVNEFTPQEAQSYLNRIGITQQLPDWIPYRPLLLATLAATGLLETVINGTEREPAAAWNYLIDQICKRESDIQKPLDATTIRRILEHLATKVRNSNDESGTVSANDIADAFQRETGREPGEAAPLLNRLPNLGLTARNQKNGTRSFMDYQMVDALRAGPVSRFLTNPYQTNLEATDWVSGLGVLGANLVVRQVLDISSDADVVSLATVAAAEASARWQSPTLTLDIVQIGRIAGASVGLETIDFEGLKIEQGYAIDMDLSYTPLPINIHLEVCQIDELTAPDRIPVGLSITQCYIKKIYGISKDASLPNWLSGTEIQCFDEEFTSNAKILEHKKLPMKVRVLMTILRKLYLQGGGGRLESALYRGMEQSARAHVDEVLANLRRHDLAFEVRVRGQTIWHSMSGMRRRVLAILSNPLSSDDSVLRFRESGIHPIVRD